MIEVENLIKSYNDIQVLQNVTFDVKKGEILGFLGANGAGKSTTMKIITCFMPQTSGNVRVMGLDVQKDSMKIREKLGYLPENCPLYLDMTVSEYLRFVAEAKKVNPREITNKISKAMSSTGIENVSHKLIAKLSKGYRQRVGLAQAIVNDPEVLVLDEPTVGLDPKQIIEIRQLIKNMAGERTVILSTHILPEVSVTCQRVVIINKGKVVAEDTPDNLTHKMRKSLELHLKIEGEEEKVVSLLKTLPSILKVKATGEERIKDYILEIKQGEEVRKEISSLIVKNDFGLYEMHQKDFSLEDIFLQLVTEEKSE
ncbi:MAG: ATP-binding cassette domain-containing protein [Candidatus Sericytochromatia bacterium]